MTSLKLLSGSGEIIDYELSGKAISNIARTRSDFNRHAIAAAHVVVDPTAPTSPSDGGAIDWDRTISFRIQLLEMGFDIAEAMDTAQRGMGLPYDSARLLIHNTVSAVGRQNAGRIYAGVGTDTLDPLGQHSLDAVERAYRQQLADVQSIGARAIFMASPSMANAAATPEDYIKLYRRVLCDADAPVILHWLGEMFDPRLKGYWGSPTFERAVETVITLIAESSDRVAGIKLSLLDEDKEIMLRAALPEGVRLYTGDDFNYPNLIAGDATHHSDALLGIFDPIAPVASTALAALAKGDRASYDALMAPTVPLARTIFEAPTRYYKTGVVFLAWLNGHQDHFAMLCGQQSMRSLPHLCQIFRQANFAGLLQDPDLAASRMRRFMKVNGVGG